MPSSAAGLLTLLDDENDELKHYALVHLNKVVHEFWFQISSYIGSVEALYEDDEFRDRELAALIASKVRQRSCMLGDQPATPASTHQSPHAWHVAILQVFYHLGELDSALTYALGAGPHFNVDEQSEYVQTLIGEQPDHTQQGAAVQKLWGVLLLWRACISCSVPQHAADPARPTPAG